jgi:hypothetical protein
MFQAWNHWPVAQIPSSGRPAVAPDRPSHTSLSHIYWDAYQKGEQTETKLLLTGLTSLPPAQLLPLAKSWISPPAITVSEGEATGAEYDPSQRAYLVHRTAAAKEGRLTLKLAASAAHPLVNPAFVIENWSGPAKVTVTTNRAKSGARIRMGYSHHIEGDSLVLFVDIDSGQETELQIDSAAK